MLGEEWCWMKIGRRLRIMMKMMVVLLLLWLWMMRMVTSILLKIIVAFHIEEMVDVNIVHRR